MSEQQQKNKQTANTLKIIIIYGKRTFDYMHRIPMTVVEKVLWRRRRSQAIIKFASLLLALSLCVMFSVFVFFFSSYDYHLMLQLDMIFIFFIFYVNIFLLVQHYKNGQEYADLAGQLYLLLCVRMPSFTAYVYFELKYVCHSRKKNSND